MTRNVRLAAIKSFFHFLEYRQPAALEQIRRVLAIPFKKTDTRLVPYLLREELQAVLDAPDPATRDGIHDRAMLHVALCAGLRVSELTGLKVDDIDLPSTSIRVLGKGRRERTLPLWKPAATALRAWLSIRGQVATPEVFVNARGEPLSRWGFAYLLKQHVATAARMQPGFAKKRVSPPVLRHTCAMIVLRATGDIRKVSLWLGHATLTTTEVYTRGDPTEKLDAIEAIVPPNLRRGVFQPTDKLIIAADPRHLGARIGITAVLHSWGSALTHHPHIHMIVPGGGISLDGQRWVSSRPAFLLPVRVLGKLFRRLFLTRLTELFDAGQLRFIGRLVGLNDTAAFRPLGAYPQETLDRHAKPPFAGPAVVLAYLSRYTHRVAISNRRLVAVDERGVTFRYKDYRREGPERYRTITLPTDGFIRRFLMHVLPRGFHRIRHYGLLATAGRKLNIARARELLAVPMAVETPAPDGSDPPAPKPPCPCCGGRMIVIDIFEPTFRASAPPRLRPSAEMRAS